MGTRKQHQGNRGKQGKKDKQRNINWNERISCLKWKSYSVMYYVDEHMRFQCLSSVLLLLFVCSTYMFIFSVATILVNQSGNFDKDIKYNIFMLVSFADKSICYYGEKSD